MKVIEVRLRWSPTNEVAVGRLAHPDRGPVAFESMDRWRRARGRDPRSLSPLDRLAYLGADHVKHFAFTMDDAGEGALAPTYDLNFAAGPGGEHSMTIDGEGRRPTLDGVLRLAARHGIARGDAIAIVERVHHVAAKWPAFAKASGVAAKQARAIATQHVRLG